MGLNTIELPAFVVEELYHSSLFSNDFIADKKEATSNLPGNESTSDPVVTLPQRWKWLGSNNKKILIIVRSEEAVHLPDNELTFLTGILGACKLSLADVAIVNAFSYPDDDYKKLTKFFDSRIVLLFEMEPSDFGLPMSFPYYQIQTFANNSFLYAPSLKDLENDKIEKSKLWVSLKRLFNL